jgi:hypothetical protein
MDVTFTEYQFDEEESGDRRMSAVEQAEDNEPAVRTSHEFDPQS